MPTRPTAIRFSPDTVHRLKMLAHRRSLEQGRDLTWAALVRQAVDALLAQADDHDPRTQGAEDA